MGPSTNGHPEGMSTSLSRLTSPDARTEVADLGDYVAVLRRRIVTVLATVLVVTVGVVAYAGAQAPSYEASARLLVRPLTSDPLEALGPASRLVDIETERQLLTSELVAEEVADVIGGIDADRLLDSVSATASDESHVMTVTATAATPEAAAERAQAFATAYLEQRRASAVDAVAASQSALEERLVTLNAELADVNETIAAAGDADGTPALASARSRRAILESQIALVAEDVASASAETLTAGEIIEAAAVPTEPAGFGLVETGIVAALAGLVIGVAAAFLRDRFDGRIREAADVEELTAAPVIGTVPAGRRARIGPKRDSAPGFALLASTLTEGGAVADHGLVTVTSPTDASTRSQSTIGLATALAQWGPVLLVDGDPVTDAVAQFAELDDVDGLTEACERPGTAHTYVRRLRDHGELSVLPAGRGRHVPRAAELETVLAELGTRWSTILIDAPPLLSSDAGLLFPKLTQRTFLVAHLGKTERQPISAARQLLRRAGQQIAGVILLGPFMHQERDGRKPPHPRPARRGLEVASRRG